MKAKNTSYSQQAFRCLLKLSLFPIRCAQVFSVSGACPWELPLPSPVSLCMCSTCETCSWVSKYFCLLYRTGEVQASALLSFHLHPARRTWSQCKSDSYLPLKESFFFFLSMEHKTYSTKNVTVIATWAESKESLRKSSSRWCILKIWVYLASCWAEG